MQRCFIRLADAVLLLVPIVAAESSHALECDKNICLWGDTIVVDRPVRAVSAWLCAVGLRTAISLYTLEATTIGNESVRSLGHHKLLDALRECSVNYRIWVFLYMASMHMAIVYGGLPLCVYTTPLCFSCIEGATQLMAYCSMQRN
jgi:hypothetical protein